MASQLIVLLGLALTLLTPAWALAAPPNFVVILADDLGYGEVGARHVGDVPTPNIDAIARGGATFTDGYATAPLCVPSRAGLLTGRYQQEFGVYGNPPDPYPASFGLPSGQRTLPEVLQARGYDTGIVGKWHLGVKPADNPLNHGFDEFFGVMDTSQPYFGEKEDNPILRGRTPVPATGYLTETFATEAASFIRRHAGQSFFLYAPFTATHRRLQATKELLARVSNIENPQRRLFAAVLAGLDDAVGTIMAALRDTGVAGNTIVVFMGDNGCLTSTTCRNTPLRGGKGSNYEGGIRVPFVLSWPDQVARGTRYTQPVISTDLFATILKAAGGNPAAVVDGVDLLPHLRGSGGSPHAYLHWGNRSNGAVRKGKWKLINGELYDLSRDLGERTNVAAANPAVVADLRRAREAWKQTLAPALW